MPSDVLKIISVLVLWIFVIIGNFICVFKNFTIYSDIMLRKIVKMHIISHMVSSIWNLTGFLISTIAGGWILGDFMCQTFGFLNLVLMSGNIWVMAVVAIERYHRFLAILDHPSTFSPRNLNIIICGIYILVILLSSGPLYGLGEYSYFKGHINLTVSIVAKMANESKLPASVDLTNYYLGSLNAAMKVGKEPDPTREISQQLLTEIGVTARTLWVEKELNVIIRSPDREILQMFLSKYQNDSVRHMLHSILWKGQIGKTIGVTDLLIKPRIDENQYYEYSTIYLESQETGMCSVDFTSYNSHAIIWSGYQLVISTCIPYLIMLVCYSIVFVKNPRSSMVLDKNVNEDDVFILNWFSLASAMCFTVTFIYYCVTLINANGRFVSADALFGISYLFYGNGLFLLLSLFIISRCHCNRVKSNCRLFCYCPEEDSAYELSDLSFRNETTEILSHCSSRQPSYI